MPFQPLGLPGRHRAGVAIGIGEAAAGPPGDLGCVSCRVRHFRLRLGVVEAREPAMADGVSPIADERIVRERLQFCACHDEIPADAERVDVVTGRERIDGGHGAASIVWPTKFDSRSKATIFWAVVAVGRLSSPPPKSNWIWSVFCKSAASVSHQALWLPSLSPFETKIV